MIPSAALVLLAAACSGVDAEPPPARPELAPAERPASAVPAPPAAEWTEALRLTRPSHEVGGEPNAVVHAPAGFRPDAPLHLVVFFHGWDCCAVSIVGDRGCGRSDPVPGGWQVGRHHDAAGTNTLLVVPQLPHLERSSDPGRFAREGFFRSWLAEVLGRVSPRLGGPRSPDDVSSVVLVAHSAGSNALLAVIRAGDLAPKIRGVVLLDALYGGVDELVRFAEADPARRILSVHTSLGATTRQSAALAKRLGSGVSLRSPVPHGEVPARHLAEVLRELGPPR